MLLCLIPDTYYLIHLQYHVIILFTIDTIIIYNRFSQAKQKSERRFSAWLGRRYHIGVEYPP